MTLAPPEDPLSNIILSIRFQHTNFGEGTNIQSIAVKVIILHHIKTPLIIRCTTFYISIRKKMLQHTTGYKLQWVLEMLNVNFGFRIHLMR